MAEGSVDASSASAPAEQLKERLLAWATEAGFRAAPSGAFVPASAVVSAARAATGSWGSDAFLMGAVLAALAQVCGGRIERRRQPATAGEVGGNIHWAVCSDMLPARPLEARPPAERPQSDKKSARAARRLERGKAPPDPSRMRVLPAEKGVVPHFTRYTDELLGLRCAPRLLELNLFPNAKELTESFACFNAARTHVAETFRPDDAGVTLVAVGDGVTPRTAALFAFRTSWQTVAIDPLMTEPEEWSKRVERLTAVRAKVEDAGVWSAPRVLLVLAHAHVDLPTCLEHVRWRDALGAIVLPCCNWYALAPNLGAPAYASDDLGVVSPHRLVRVWRWRRDECLPTAVPPPQPCPL